MSADRLNFRPAQFVDSGSTYAEVFGDGFVDRGKLIHQLRRRQGFLEKHNGLWIDGELRAARLERHDPLLDVLAVTETGEVLNSYSTYTALKYNSQLALTEGDMVEASRRRKKFVLFLTGECNSALIWHESNGGQVLEALRAGFGSIDVEDYSVNGNSSDIKVAHVRGGVMGEGKFAKQGIIYGQLGFWENRQLSMGEHGAHVNIQRVRFDKSAFIGDTFVSPLNSEEVLKRGGTPMDLKHGGVDVIRVDTSKTGGDFIVGAVRATKSQFSRPVILRYTTMRPWKGEVPRHG